MMLLHVSIGNPAKLARRGLLGAVMEFAVKFDELLQALPEGEFVRIAETDSNFMITVEAHGYDDYAPKLNLEGFGFPSSFNCCVEVAGWMRAVAMVRLYVSADGTRARGELHPGDGEGDEFLTVDVAPVPVVVTNLAEAALDDLKVDLARWARNRHTEVA